MAVWSKLISADVYHNFGHAATIVDKRRQTEINFGFNFSGNFIITSIFPCKLALNWQLINLLSTQPWWLGGRALV